jgi:hypothetical protein
MSSSLKWIADFAAVDSSYTSTSWHFGDVAVAKAKIKVWHKEIDLPMPGSG